MKWHIWEFFTEHYRWMGKNFSLHEKQSDLCWKAKRMKSPEKVSQVHKTWWHFFCKTEKQNHTREIQTPYTTFRHHLEVHWIWIECSGCWEEANNNKMFNTINFNKITKTNLEGTIGWNQILPRARKQRKTQWKWKLRIEFTAARYWLDLSWCQSLLTVPAGLGLPFLASSVP